MGFVCNVLTEIAFAFFPQVRFKLKPLDEIEPKFRKRLLAGQLQSASEARSSV